MRAAAPTMLGANNALFLTRLTLVGGAASLVFALVYFALNSLPDALFSLALAVTCGGIVLAWKMTGGRRLVLHVGIGVTTSLFAALIAYGLLAYLAWLGLVCIIAFMLLGRRAGTIWSLVILGLMAGLMVIHSFGANDHLSQGVIAVRMLRVIVLVPALAGVGYFFEQQRSQNIKSLEQAMATRSRLLANVSHEMRTPLNGIIGLTQALKFERLPTSTLESLTVVQQSGETLLSLINDLLDVAHAEAGKTDFAKHAFELTQLVSRAVVQTRLRPEAAGVRIDFETPAGDGDVWVQSDSVRLQQVVGTLLAAAMRQGPKVFVKLQVERAVTHVAVRLSVKDHGPGLTAEQRTRLFQPFVQLDPQEAGAGSGLGLFISQSLARGLGGDLSVDSEPGKGTTLLLTLSLPVAAPLAESDSTPPAVRVLHGRVLVVDDNAINRRVAEALLSKLGLAVTSVDSGIRALAWVQEQGADLVLMDLQMPELDGLETCRRLRSNGFNGPIVALTASALPETANECADAGMNGCLVKPLRLELAVPMLEHSLQLVEHRRLKA